MFSEVYWHHAVRSATAMFQRAFWELATDPTLRDSSESLPLEPWNSLDEATWIARMRGCSQGKPWSRLVESLFGDHRTLYKRLAEFHSLKTPDLHRALACRPYHELVTLSRRLAKAMSAEPAVKSKRPISSSMPPHPSLKCSSSSTYGSRWELYPAGRDFIRGAGPGESSVRQTGQTVRIFVAPSFVIACDRLISPSSSKSRSHGVILSRAFRESRPGGKRFEIRSQDHPW